MGSKNYCLPHPYTYKYHRRSNMGQVKVHVVKKKNMLVYVKLKHKTQKNKTCKSYGRFSEISVRLGTASGVTEHTFYYYAIKYTVYMF